MLSERNYKIIEFLAWIILGILIMPILIGVWLLKTAEENQYENLVVNAIIVLGSLTVQIIYWAAIISIPVAWILS